MIREESLVYEIPDGDCRIRLTNTGVQLGKKVLPTESARFCFDELAWPFGRAKVNSAAPSARYLAIKADLPKAICLAYVPRLSDECPDHGRVREKEIQSEDLHDDIENGFTAFASAKEASKRTNDQRFSSAKELGRLAENWSASKLVEIWNTLPGVIPVKRFTSRKKAVLRIWAALQNLTPHVGAQLPEAGSKRDRSARRAQCDPPGTRDGSKKAEILVLLRRKGGATRAEIMRATEWQARSVRGFLSGALRKKMGLTVGSVKREDGERVYTIAS